MPELARRERLKDRVVFGVRSGQHDMLRSREFEDDALERGESRRIEVLDDLDDGGCFKAVEPLVAIGQRSLNQLDPTALPFWQLIEPQALLRDFERSPGDIHAEDGLELLLGKEKPQQLAFATAEIEYPLRAGRLDDGQDRLQSLRMQRRCAFRRL